MDTNSFHDGSRFRQEMPTLQAIHDKFHKLLVMRDQAFAQRQSLPGRDKWVLAEAELSKTAIDPICEELQALAWTAADIPARNALERRYKAEILREHVEGSKRRSGQRPVRLSGGRLHSWFYELRVGPGKAVAGLPNGFVRVACRKRARALGSRSSSSSQVQAAASMLA